MPADRRLILLVDDERVITDPLCASLKREGYAVLVAPEGEAALRMIRGDRTPDLVLLDIDLPGIDGREVLRQLRTDQNGIPVILLSKLGETSDQLGGFRDGADDYIAKPYDTSLLIARIEAVLRRAGDPARRRAGDPAVQSARRLRSGPLVFDRNLRVARLGDDDVELTPKEATLLEHLMTHYLEEIDRHRLAVDVWRDKPGDVPRDTGFISTCVSDLRRKLRDDPHTPTYIATTPPGRACRHGGYQFIGSVEPA